MAISLMELSSLMEAHHDNTSGRLLEPVTNWLLILGLAVSAFVLFHLFHSHHSSLGMTISAMQAVEITL